MAEIEKTENRESEITNKDKSSPGNQTAGNIPIYKKKSIIVPTLIILIASIAGVYWYIGQLAYLTSDDAYIDGNKVSISSKILGRISWLSVDEGDSVFNNQLIVKLDSADLKSQEIQSKASINFASVSLNLSKVNLAKAQDDFRRAEQQYKDNVIPKEQFDHIQKALEIAKAQLSIDKTKIETSNAQLNVISTALQNTSIFSPMSGVVAKRWLLEGDVVQPGQPILTIVDLKNIWVTAYLEETNLSAIKIGDKVEVSVDAYPDQKFSGQIFQIGSNTASQFSLIPPSNASGNFTKVTQRIPVKISIKPTNEYGKLDTTSVSNLLPGMSVEIKIKIK